MLSTAFNSVPQAQLVEKYCPPIVKKIVVKYVTSSGYFAHPELLLLTLLASDSEEERRFAVNIIVNRIRNGDVSGSHLPRKFAVSAVNFKADDLVQLIDWETVPLTEPLLTATLSTEEVAACAITPLSVPATWQCHSQSMDRAIRKVSEASLMVVGEQKREGWVRCADASRKALKKPNSKADYMSLLELNVD